jgi:GTP cyclohydrolase II
MIVRLAESPLRTHFGTFLEVLYYDGQHECLALVMGEVQGREDVLCRVHSHCVAGHFFNSIECDCREQMAMAQAMVAQAGAGVIIWLDQEGRGNGHLALLRSRTLCHQEGLSQTEAYVRLGYAADAREYSSAAAILRDLGLASVVLMTNSPHKISSLQEAGIQVTGTRPLALDAEGHTALQRLYADKIAQGHRL